MQAILKPFAALGIALRSNVFLRARLRLAVFYTGIIAVILVLFSQLIFVSFQQSILQTAREYREHYAVREEDETYFVQQEENQLIATLLILNGGILIISAGLSYFLAGSTLKPIQKSLLQQKQFLSDASHELRTPLAVLKTNMEVSLDNPKKVSAQEEKDIISNLEEVNKMTNLVNELLLLSRLDTQPSTQKKEIAFSDLLTRVYKRFLSYAKSRQVSLEIDLPKKTFMVKGDEDALFSAFSNLIKNAIDYNKKGGSVHMSATEANGSVQIDVEDTGIGISQDQLPFIFNRFYRVDKSRTSKIQGSGLGLSIVQAVVQEHQGKITLESVEGKGTRFVILLPLSS